MYVAHDEQRQFSGKVYSGDNKLDIYVKGACVLDRSLKINEQSYLTLLTNDVDAINDSLKRINYKGLKIESIPFDFNVTPGCAFYSAHYKIDVFRYLGTRKDDEYSVLLDSDVVSILPLGKDFYSVVESGIPMVYNLPGYGGIRRMQDINKIDPSMTWCVWTGGEFIGGDAAFFAALYNDIISFKEDYWKNINNGLFHVGDEMLTSIALNHLHQEYNTIDAGILGIVYRYWSIYDDQSYDNVGASLVHFPGDKDFFYKADLSGKRICDIMRGYRLYRIKALTKGRVKKILDKNWKSKL